MVRESIDKHMFALYDHNERDPKIENCINTIKGRIIYTDATFEDILADEVFVEDYGPDIENIWLAYKAAEILVADLNNKKA